MNVSLQITYGPSKDSIPELQPQILRPLHFVSGRLDDRVLEHGRLGAVAELRLEDPARIIGP